MLRHRSVRYPVFVLVSLLTACGGGGGGAAPSAPQPIISSAPGPVQTPTPTPSPGGPSPAPANWNDEVFVSNSSANSVTIYRAGTNGNAGPGATIFGTNTNLSAPQGIAVDAACNVYVSNSPGTNGGITVYGGSLGNVAPVRTLANVSAYGLFADNARSVLYAAEPFALQVDAYALGVSVPNTPLRQITWPAMGQPYGVAVDSAGNLYVADRDGEVFEYGPAANGQTTPISTIVGNATQLSSPSAIALDAHNDIYVVNGGTNTVTVYSAGAQGDIAPISTIGTPSGTITGIATDSTGYIFLSVSAAGGGAIYAIAPGSAGTSSITGSVTGLDGPTALAIAPPPSCS